jgi:hypothetical protein
MINTRWRVSDTGLHSITELSREPRQGIKLMLQMSAIRRVRRAN